MFRRWSRAFGAFGLAATVVRCSSFSGDPSGHDAADAGDSSASEGSVLDASSADTDAYPRNAGFELEGSACAPGWAARYGTLTRVPIPHSGRYGCMVCSNGTSSVVYLAATPPIVDPKPGQWNFEMWAVRGADAGAKVRALLNAAVTYDGAPTENPLSGGDAPSAYTSIQLSALVRAGATALEISASIDTADAGDCAIFDDAALTWSSL